MTDDSAGQQWGFLLDIGSISYPALEGKFRREVILSLSKDDLLPILKKGEARLLKLHTLPGPVGLHKRDGVQVTEGIRVGCHRVVVPGVADAGEVAVAPAPRARAPRRE